MHGTALTQSASAPGSGARAMTYVCRAGRPTRASSRHGPRLITSPRPRFRSSRSITCSGTGRWRRWCCLGVDDSSAEQIRAAGPSGWLNSSRSAGTHQTGAGLPIWCGQDLIVVIVAACPAMFQDTHRYFRLADSARPLPPYPRCARRRFVAGIVLPHSPRPAGQHSITFSSTPASY